MKKILIILFLIFISKNAYAARIFIDDNIRVLPSSHEFSIDLLLDTEGISVNALKTEIIYPDELMTLTRTTQDNSVISTWINPINVNGNSITFSGIIFNGTENILDPITNETKYSKIVTLHFKPKMEGNGIIKISDSTVYKNDGLGIPIKINDEPFAFVLDKNAPVNGEEVDTTAPEEFTPYVKSFSEIFDGMYVVIFMAKDTGSGINHYEVKEGNSEWVNAESPYKLYDQSLRSKIQVKAVDNAGNIRIEVIPGSGYYIYLYLLLILLIIIFIIYRIRIFIKKQVIKITSH